MDKSLLPHVKHTLWVLVTHAFPGVERKQVKSIKKTLIKTNKRVTNHS